MPAPKKTAANAKKPVLVDAVDVRVEDAVTVLEVDGNEYQLSAEVTYRLRKALDRALVEMR